MKKGVDISTYNVIDYNKLDAEFAIIRAGYGKVTTQKDNKFEQHYAGLHGKMPIGAYWYSYAKNANEAVQEAKACIEVIKGKKFELPIYFDIEEKLQYALGKQVVSDIITAFCTELEKAGYFAGFYTNTSWYNSVINDNVKKRFACWIAHWNVSKPGITGSYGCWQYKVGKLTGAQGDIDLDYLYEDYPTIIKEKGLNGYSSDEGIFNINRVTVLIDGKEYRLEPK